MKCHFPGCEAEAVCLFCSEHRPLWMPAELERPAVGPDAITADLDPERMEAALETAGGTP